MLVQELLQVFNLVPMCVLEIVRVTIPQSGSVDVTVTTTNPTGPFRNQNIRITLFAPQTGATYAVASGGAGSDTVLSKDNTDTSGTNPRVSIAADSTEKVRVDLNRDAIFTITASVEPTRQIELNLKLTETGDFIADGNETLAPFRLTTGRKENKLQLETRDPSTNPDADSDITVEILEGSNYSLADSPGHKATVTATDDALPLVSIMTEYPDSWYDRVSDTDYVEYILSATGISTTLTVDLNLINKFK